jgi:hypothetical protein
LSPAYPPAYDSGLVIELSEYISRVLVVAKLKTEVPQRRNTLAPFSTSSRSSHAGSVSNSSNSRLSDAGASGTESTP